MAKFNIVFDDWRDSEHRSVYEQESFLSWWDFHKGTTFEVEINLPEDSAQELQQRINDGYIPVFYLKND